MPARQVPLAGLQKRSWRKPRSSRARWTFAMNHRRRAQEAWPRAIAPGRSRRAVRGRRQCRPDLQAAVHQLEEARHPSGWRDCSPVRQAGQDRRFHQRLRRSLRSLPARVPRCTPGSTSPDHIGTPIYATADGMICRRRLEQRRLRQPHQDRPWPRHRNPLRPLVGDAGSRRPARQPRRADRPHGLDRPLDRQPPPLRSSHRRPCRSIRSRS